MNSDAVTHHADPAGGLGRPGLSPLAELEADWRAAQARLAVLVKREREMQPEAYDLAQRQAHSEENRTFDLIESCQCANVQELRTKYALLLERCIDENGDILHPEPFLAFRADLDLLAAASGAFPSAADRLAALHAEAAEMVSSGRIVALAADWRAAYRQAEADEKKESTARTAAEEHYGPHPAKFMPRGAEAPQADIDSWKAAARIIDGAFGVPGLEQAASRGFAIAQEIAAEIRALQPTNSEEACLRHVITREYEDPEIDRIDKTDELFALIDRLLLVPPLRTTK